ncbi:DUF6115 domain-containing protein [Virgibacillus soli]|uniref:Coupling factor for flagellin transcription and translation n=1 Tax=Paracerasibacillus soli TaxID=480284 RepID=A0ABU5CPN8_9BACI|nr:hypothetical protein [Virgibacillus soli]MDY0408185.1 hypothetical protein [Virgibacillus soli]
MTGFLLTISFILHAISLFAIYVLVKRGSIVEKTPSKEEIIQLFDQYLAEIKEENQKLQQNIQYKENVRKHPSFTQSKTSVRPTEEITFQDELPIEENVDEIETSLQAKVLQLYNQGKTIEEIASKLGCGKTEADLIVKFNKKM